MSYEHRWKISHLLQEKQLSIQSELTMESPCPLVTLFSIYLTSKKCSQNSSCSLGIWFQLSARLLWLEGKYCCFQVGSHTSALS